MNYKGFKHSLVLCTMMLVFLKSSLCDYNCVPASPEYTYLNGTKGSFSSPNYPDSYPNNMTHIWRINIATKLRIQLYIFIDQVQEKESTNKTLVHHCLDYIEIKEKADNGRGKLIARTCGSRRVFSFLSVSGNISISLVTDCSVVSKGFKAVFSVFRQMCPKGWLFFDSSCYKLFKSKYTWFKARKTCQQMNGDLVSISNADEHELISGMTSWKGEENYWIGLNDLDKEGEYQWTDESPFSYKNWKNLEPNNDLGREDCVEIASKDPKWNDDYCEKKYGFICKMSKASTMDDGRWIVIGLFYTMLTMMLERY